MPPQILPMALIGGIDIDGFLCSQVRIGDDLAEFIGISVLHTGKERGAADGEPEVMECRRMIIDGRKGIDIAVMGVGHLGQSALGIILLNLITLPCKPADRGRCRQLGAQTGLILNGEGVDTLADMGHRLADVMRSVDIIFIVCADLQVVAVGCRPNEVGIGSEGIIVVDARPPLLALLSGISEIVVGVKGIVEGIVPQPALQRQCRCQFRCRVEVDFVLFPFRIDAELRPAVASQVRGNMFLGVDMGVADYIFVRSVRRIAHFRTDIEIARPRVQALVAVEIGGVGGIAVGQPEVRDVGIAHVYLPEPVTPSSAKI